MLQDREYTPEEVARRKIQSIIKSWLLQLEQMPLWSDLPLDSKKMFRRAVIRVGWGAYKIGLLTPFDPTEITKESTDASSD